MEGLKHTFIAKPLGGGESRMFCQFRGGGCGDLPLPDDPSEQARIVARHEAHHRRQIGEAVRDAKRQGLASSLKILGSMS